MHREKVACILFPLHFSMNGETSGCAMNRQDESTSHVKSRVDRLLETLISHSNFCDFSQPISAYFMNFTSKVSLQSQSVIDQRHWQSRPAYEKILM